MPIGPDPSPNEPEPNTDRSPSVSSDAPAMMCPELSIVSTPRAPAGAPLRNAPVSFDRLSTSFSAAAAAAAVAWTDDRELLVPVADIRMSPKLEDVPVAFTVRPGADEAAPTGVVTPVTC